MRYAQVFFFFWVGFLLVAWFLVFGHMLGVVFSFLEGKWRCLDNLQVFELRARTPDQWGYSRICLMNIPSEALPNRQALHAFTRSLFKVDSYII